MKKYFFILELLTLFSFSTVYGQQAGAPVLLGAGNTPLVYLEGSEAASISPQVQISDNSSQQMMMATFQFGDGYDPENDRLTFDETSDIKSYFDPASGTLYLLASSAVNGVSTQDMQSAMRSVSYFGASDDPGNKEMAVNITVTDLEGNRSRAVSRTLSVRPTNDAPLLLSERTGPIEATPGREYQIFESLTIDDPDDRIFIRAVIQIEGFNQDRLDIEDDEAEDNDIEIDEESRILTITGSGNASIYRKILLSATYEHDPFFGFRQDGIRTVSLRLTDAQGATSNRLARYFVVQPLLGSRINVPPSVQDEEIIINEGTSLTFDENLFENGFNDINNDRLVGITIESLPQHGKLFFDGRAITNQFVISDSLIRRNRINLLTYDPDPLYNGDDDFRWNARDPENFAASDANFTINIRSVNQDPVLSIPNNIEVDEDTPTPVDNISVEDLDRKILRVFIEADQGNLLLPASVVDRELFRFLNGTQNGEKEIRIEGPAALVAFALSGLEYLSPNNFAGSDRIDIRVNDREGGNIRDDIDVNVRAVNDAPRLLSLETGILTYTEDQEAVPISNTLTIDDEENDLIASASITISQNFEENDLLSVVDFEGIDSEYEDGTLTLEGEASPAVYQNLLRNVRFSSSGQNPKEGNRTVDIVVTDVPGAQSEIVQRVVEVVPVNDAPVLTDLEENSLGFVPGGAAINITNEIKISDPDNNNLVKAIVSFEGGNYDPDTDLLDFEDAYGISDSWNRSQGILTLMGTAPIADYQKALRQVTYQNSSEQNLNTDRTISILVDDGDKTSNLLERELVPNQPPLVSSFDKTTDEEQPITFLPNDFPFQDTDNFPDGELFGIIITQLPTKGVLTLDNDTLTTDQLNQVIERDDIAQLQYRPLPDQNGPDTFHWNASDGASFADQDAEVDITINPLPDPPTALDFLIETDEDQIFSFTDNLFIESSQDPDGDELVAVVVSSLPTHGQLLLNDISLPANSQLSLDDLNQLEYQPDENYNGPDFFNWLASDGSSNSLTAASVNINVRPVNDAPQVSSFTRAINTDENYSFSEEDFSQNYTDLESDLLLAIRIVSQPEFGVLTVNNTPLEAGALVNSSSIGDMVYQPASISGNIQISFDWEAFDGELFSANSATVTVIVGVGVTDFAINAQEDVAYPFSFSQFANNYGNPDAELSSIRIENLPQNGSLFLDGNPIEASQEIADTELTLLTYLPNPDFSGEDSFEWSASSGSAYTEQSAAVQIEILPVNDAPSISDIADQSVVAGSSSGTINFSVSDPETEAEDLSITVFSGDESIIPSDQISVSGGSGSRNLTVNVPDGTAGTLTITIVVSDGDKQSEIQFSIEVAPYAIDIATDNLLEICLGESGSSQLSVVGGEAPYQIQTVCPDGECSASYVEGIVSFEPQSTTTYFISLVDANGIRSNVDTVVVEVLDCEALQLDIPTAFTPNGDQVNDQWLIGNIQFADVAVVQIFDRNGLAIYNSQGYDQPWDGTYENKQLPAGTYYYVIQLEDGAEVYNGSVSILR